MGQPEHSKIINKVARQILKPEGLERKGQSRTWYDDHGWFTTIVEFQPHKWKHGAFLNVGVNFHWYEKDYTSFDIGYRESGFEEFESAEQFISEIESMVKMALEKVHYYRSKLMNLTTSKASILDHTFTSDTLWGNYHKGVICALTKDNLKSEFHFKAILEVDHDVAWADELKNRTRELLKIIDNQDSFESHIYDVIARARSSKKLKEIEFDLK